MLTSKVIETTEPVDTIPKLMILDSNKKEEQFVVLATYKSGKGKFHGMIVSGSRDGKAKIGVTHSTWEYSKFKEFHGTVEIKTNG